MPTTSIAHRVARRAATLLAAAAVALAGLAVPAALQLETANAAAVHRLGPDFGDRVLALTNHERTSRGLAPLAAARCGDRFASKQAHRMARRDRMFHQNLRRVLRKCDMRTAGENVAWTAGGMSPEQVVGMWMRSPGHRANILDPRFRLLGVEAVQSGRSGRVYAGQVFGA